jgi:hypothetical protein
VKFFGGGFNTFAAKVFPSPLFPWQALQCLKKMSRPVTESRGSAKAIEEENKHTSKPTHQLSNLITPPYFPLVTGKFYQTNTISRNETVIVHLKML